MDPQQMAAIITRCLEQGLEPPLCLCAVGVNGTLLAMRYGPAHMTQDIYGKKFFPTL